MKYIVAHRGENSRSKESLIPNSQKMFLLQIDQVADISEQLNPWGMAVWGALVVSGWIVAWFVWKQYVTTRDKLTDALTSLATETNASLKDMTNLLEKVNNQAGAADNDIRRILAELNAGVAKLATVIETILKYTPKE